MKLATILSLLCLAASVLGQVGQVSVNIKYGQVDGNLVRLTDGTEIASFHAVPFGRAPVGDLRFAAPQEPDNWAEPFQATRMGTACIQRSSNVGITHPTFDNYSEDCLHVNIQTPHNSATPGPYPVMVYFHGGAYQSSANFQYPGHFLASRNVIAVSANYRLGAIGFVSTEDPVAPGNWGMLDQVLALRFVQENIAAFGGDPNRVTIYGQSAGGAAVGLLLLSPMSEGLFQQAMMFSGTDTAIWSANPPTGISANFTRQAALQLDCPTTPNADMIACMRTRDALLLREVRPEVYPGRFSLGFVPVVDGSSGFLPDEPFNMRRANKFHKVPLVSGVTSNEVGPILLDIEDGVNLTTFRTMIDGALLYTLALEPQEKLDQLAAATTFQYTGWPHKQGLVSNRDGLNNLFNDLAFGTAADTSLKFQSAEVPPTYMYNFGYRSDILDEILPQWTGVFHAADVPYIFGHPHLSENSEVADDTEMDVMSVIPWSQDDLDYSAYWMDLLTNFAKTGNPTPSPVNGPGTTGPTTWHAFDNNQLQFLNVSKGHIHGQDSWRQQAHAMWQDYTPYILDGEDGEGPSLHLIWPLGIDSFGDLDFEVFTDMLENVMAGLDLMPR